MVGSKPPTSAAILLAGCSFSGILVTLQTPDFPSTIPCQKCSRPIPTGETAPIPVTTTRSFDIASNPILIDPSKVNRRNHGDQGQSDREDADTKGARRYTLQLRQR